ncbi:hypothetical protein BOX15_Mlig020219g1, partial [Macrostomum lignano]
KYPMPSLSRLSTTLLNYCRFSRLPWQPTRLLCDQPAPRLPRVYEPEYLDYKPDYPAANQFNLSFTCHEYPVLERFVKYAHSLLRNQFKLGPDNCRQVPYPQRKTIVDLYQPESTKVRDTFQLITYRRVLIVDNLPAVEMSLLINLLAHNLPEGVNLKIEQPSEEDDEFRFVPDLEVQELKKQVELGRSGK